MRIYNYISLLLIIITFVSCTKEPPILQQKKVFDNASWNRYEYLKYSPVIVDNSSAYTFKLQLELTEEYPYNYLRIQLDKSNEEGEEYVKIFSIPVKDQYGVFLKEPQNGIYRVNTVLTHQMYFSSPGKYKINIEELMPPYYLKGVKSAEFIIEKRTK